MMQQGSSVMRLRMKAKGAILAFLLLGMVMVGFAATPMHAWAQTTGSPSTTASDSCTDFAKAKQEAFGTGATSTSSGAGNTGLLSDIYNYVKEVVGEATQNLFSAFTESDAYQNAMAAVFTLVVLFYGVTFMMGMVQVSFGDILKRLVKIGVVATLISPGGWAFFNDTVVRFFNDGTDDLVKAVMEIGTGQQIPTGATPFYQLDQIAKFIIQPNTIRWAIGTLTTGGPYALAVGAMSSIAILGFLKLLVDALKIYAVSFVARAMLLGLAPIFFAFLLFERTKTLFMNWLNSVLSMALQPILMFTFLSFFIVLIQSAAKDMLSVDVCWTDYKNVAGTTNSFSGDRLKDPKTGEPIKGDLSWNGWLSCTLGSGSTSGTSTATSSSGTNSCPEFPVNIIDILTFLILIYIAQQFSKNIENIANELANASISVGNAGGAFATMLQGQAQKVGSWISGGGPVGN